MNISGFGKTYTYIYNAKTGKMKSKDGEPDEFVDYFNDSLDGRDSKTLNEFDKCRKYVFKNFNHMNYGYMDLVDSSLNLFDLSVKEEYEISQKIDDVGNATYYLDGRELWTSFNAGPFAFISADDIFSKEPYRTHTSKGYDSSDNSINLAVGDIFDLGDNYRVQIKENTVWGEGYRGGCEAEVNKRNCFEYALNALIRFADQLGMSASITSEATPMLLEFLKQLGVDTSRQFIINGTKCELRNGQIEEVGNEWVVPGSVYKKALAMYEEAMSKPLSEGEE